MSRNGKIRIFLVLTAVVLSLALSVLLSYRAGATSAKELIDNESEVIASIRQGLKEHAAKITVTFSCKEELLDHMNNLAEEWMEVALEETDDPAEGDYLRYQMGGFTSNATAEPGDETRYTLEIIPEYYVYLFQEEAAGEKAEELIAAFDFSEETPDLRKISTVYDYLCQHVRYDEIHRKNPYSHVRSTAYAALVKGSATCQGYAVSLYRLLRMAGVNCRVVTGTARGEEGLHAWNLVELDGLWYYLDATWDAGKEEYQWFLRGTDDFPDHSLGEAFLLDAFQSAYPLSRRSYFDP